MLNFRPGTSTEYRLLFQETLLNLTTLVSKISDNSVLSGISGGVAKVAQKAEKDIIIAVSQLFPDEAFGASLDQVASNFGISPRFGPQGSSVYVRVFAQPGTVYAAASNIFKSTSGISFQFLTDVTIDQSGYAYIACNSIDIGLRSNVDLLTVSTVSPLPAGHLSVINEVSATGGYDSESDELLRIRIKDGANILARGTLASLEQLFIATNNKVLKIFHQGMNAMGQIQIAIATQNGQALTNIELSQLLNVSSTYATLTDYAPFGSTFQGLNLINIGYTPINISFRVQLDPSINPDDIRKSIMVQIQKKFDFRFFKSYRDRITWTDLYNIVKNTKGVIYAPDTYFYPNVDVAVRIDQLPRLQGFLMLTLDGGVIANLTGTLAPLYYQNKQDFSYTRTVLGK